MKRGNIMLFVLVAGLFAGIAPTWMICAAGLGAFEDEAALRWLVRIVVLGVAGLALYLMSCGANPEIGSTKAE